MAIQGSVANFATGIVLIATKPFKIGDTLTVHDTYGEVQDIKLAYTVLVNEPIVGIEAFGDSAISIGYRYWVLTDSFFKSQYNINQKVFDILDKSNIVIPFPQREIRMLKEV